MERRDLCTVVINSCDGYADIRVAFLTLLDRYWPDRPWPLVLNTETLPGLGPQRRPARRHAAQERHGAAGLAGAGGAPNRYLTR